MRKKQVISLSLAAMIAITPVIEPVTVCAKEDAKEQTKAADRETADSKEEAEDAQEGETAEEEITTLEGARETIKGYHDSETEWEEVRISSVEELMEFSRDCWLDTWSQNKKVYLTQDLNLTGSGFIPIPTFGGYFDGQGHTISGLTVTDSISYAGLFNYTQQTAAIVNLNVRGTVRPEGQQVAVGGIVGDNSGIIMNCTFDGTVEGNDYVGGLTGFNELTGIIIDCKNGGRVTGMHYTGGVAGENVGNIVRCVNEARINTSNEDKQMSIDDINLGQYANSLLGLAGGEDGNSDKEESIVNNSIDTGGIAGLSTGIIQFCTNKGNIGYEHVGYNIGGIAGRQSGYLYACENTASVYGRKDVGGIAGQAEPYVAVDLSEDIAYQLTDNINALHDLIDKMLDDAGSESDTVSNRLSVIQSFADKALDDTAFLADKTVEWTDGMVGAVNDTVSRLDYVVSESSKEGGAIDQTQDAAGNMKNAADELSDAVESLDIYDYMTEEEKERYNSAKENLKNATKEHSESYADMAAAYRNYYIDKVRSEEEKYKGNNIPTEKDLRPYVDADGTQDWKYDWAGPKQPADYLTVEYWGHVIYTQDGTEVYAIYELGKGQSPDSAQNEMDEEFLADVDKQIQNNAVQIEGDAERYANDEYFKKHGSTYTSDIQNYAKIMSDIISAHTDEMSGEARKKAEKALDYASDAADNMEDAGGEVKHIASTLSGMPDIVMPQLGGDYRSKTSSLAANLQGISENMGFLNNEMSSGSDVLAADLEAVNDQFSSIMILYTDAIDGVLDVDYSTAFEDQSEEDAEESTDATISGCKNSGEVRGDLNISGIAGTMAIEYDFDLESDVTGIENAKANSTFLTKCVLRQNVNIGKITAQKSYAGGASGLQEMGMILRCENYGNIQSTAGDYVGGIAGQSFSHITSSYAKCAVSGGEYVAGIAGSGSSVENCCAMVKVKEATAFYGAIAGEVDSEGSVFGNYFVSEEIAGIDRVSYSGKAEPVSYNKLLEIEGLPKQFRMMKITFYADEREVQQIECRYGGSVPLEQYPDIPTKKGFYADWDIKDLQNVRYDEDVTVEYVRYLTTLAGSQLRDNGQSVILADGTFKTEDALGVESLEITDVIMEGTDAESIAEHWLIEIPDDGTAQHQIRYQAPQGQTKNVEIYVKTAGGWQKADTELMGIYHLFTVEGPQAEIAVSVVQNDITRYIVFGAAGAAAVIVLIVVLLLRKKKKRRASQEAEPEDIPDK